MKTLVRGFFKTIRALLTPIVLLWDYAPVFGKVSRSPAEQQRMDEATSNLVLYDFRTCPFCIKVRRAARRLGLTLETRDAQHDETNRAELLASGGEIKVPCLRITNAQGDQQWLYESDAIVAYLESLAASTAAPEASASASGPISVDR